MHSGTRPFEDQTEFEQFLRTIDGEFQTRNRALVTLGAYAGLRIKSALSLAIGDVFDGKKFRKSVRVARKSMKGKRGSFVIPLHPRAAFALARWLVTLRRRGHRLGPETPVFVSRCGSSRAISVRMAQKMVRQTADLAGLDAALSTHSWRKFFAKRVYERSGNCLLTTAQALAHGTNDLRSTARYLTFQITRQANSVVMNL